MACPAPRPLPGGSLAAIPPRSSADSTAAFFRQSPQSPRPIRHEVPLVKVRHMRQVLSRQAISFGKSYNPSPPPLSSFRSDSSLPIPFASPTVKRHRARPVRNALNTAFQFVVLRRLPVILQRLRARRLLPATPSQIANLQQFRRGEKHHVYRIVVNGNCTSSPYPLTSARIPAPLRLHRASQPRRPAPTHTMS